ncbi:MAG: hypothetical protein R3E04_10880 [Sphingobium sp.]
MRVAFLFNHDQIHQVAHSLPIAMALANGGFAGEIIVATTNERMATEVRRVAGGLLDTHIRHVELSLSSRSKRLARFLGGILPAAKLLVYRDNLDFFRSLDLLVVAEKTSLLLKSHYGLHDLKIVHTRHGAGDRAIGFDKASAGFDHVLCSGPKIKDRLITEARVDPARISIVGYPKFDLIERPVPVHRLHQSRPTVLYNPHVSPHLSSWYRHGWEVIDVFRDNDEYELVFAPHVMLFERRFVVTIDKLTIDRAGTIPHDFLRGDNIHIDLGSRFSTNMRYTLASDIYLGDASSQIYEFLIQPRPCIFINSHGHDWRGNPNFRHWDAGEVISNPDELPGALGRAAELHETQFRAIQEQMFAESFDLQDTPSSTRAAEVIASLAEGQSNTTSGTLRAA